MEQRLQNRARLGALPRHHLLHHCWRLNVGCRDLWSGPAGDLFCYVQSWHRCQEMTAVPQLILQSSFNPITEVAVLSAAGSPWNNREAGCGISGALAAGGRSPERGKGHLGLSEVRASSAVPAWGCLSSAYWFFIWTSLFRIETHFLLLSTLLSHFFPWCVLWRKEYEETWMWLGKMFNENK